MTNSKELKEKIVNSLSEWKVQREKSRFLNFRSGEKISFNLFDAEDLHEIEKSITEYPKKLKESIVEELLEVNIVDSNNLKKLDWTLFGEQDRRIISRAIVDNVKHYKSEWEIKKLCTLDFGGRNEDETVLIHHSAQINYDEQGFLIRECGKLFFKNEFSIEEWRELESTIQSQQQTQQVEQSKSWLPFRGDSSKH